MVRIGKYLKAEVDVRLPAKGMDHCKDCVHYQPITETCEIVEGLVLRNDWCKRFKRK